MGGGGGEGGGEGAEAGGGGTGVDTVGAVAGEVMFFCGVFWGDGGGRDLVEGAGETSF